MGLIIDGTKKKIEINEEDESVTISKSLNTDTLNTRTLTSNESIELKGPLYLSEKTNTIEIKPTNYNGAFTYINDSFLPSNSDYFQAYYITFDITLKNGKWLRPIPQLIFLKKSGYSFITESEDRYPIGIYVELDNNSAENVVYNAYLCITEDLFIQIEKITASVNGSTIQMLNLSSSDSIVGHVRPLNIFSK